MKNYKTLPALTIAFAMIAFSVAQADDIITPSSPGSFFDRLGAFGDSIYGSTQQVVNSNTQVAWVGGENADYRGVYEFDIANQGLTAANIASVTLTFTASTIGNGGNTLEVDQVAADLFPGDNNQQYAPSLNTILTSQPNSGVYTVDITSLFEAQLATASSTNGLGIRFFNNNNPEFDPSVFGAASPFTAPGTVNFTAGYSVSGLSIDVATVPEPSILCLGVAGAMALVFFRRRLSAFSV